MKKQMFRLTINLIFFIWLFISCASLPAFAQSEYQTRGVNSVWLKSYPTPGFEGSETIDEINGRGFLITANLSKGIQVSLVNYDGEQVWSRILGGGKDLGVVQTLVKKEFITLILREGSHLNNRPIYTNVVKIDLNGNTIQQVGLSGSPSGARYFTKDNLRLVTNFGTFNDPKYKLISLSDTFSLITEVNLSGIPNVCGLEENEILSCEASTDEFGIYSYFGERLRVYNSAFPRSSEIDGNWGMNYLYEKNQGHTVIRYAKPRNSNFIQSTVYKVNTNGEVSRGFKNPHRADSKLAFMKPVKYEDRILLSDCQSDNFFKCGILGLDSRSGDLQFEYWPNSNHYGITFSSIINSDQGLYAYGSICENGNECDIFLNKITINRSIDGNRTRSIEEMVFE